MDEASNSYPTLDTVLEAMERAGLEPHTPNQLGQFYLIVKCPWGAEHPKGKLIESRYYPGEGRTQFGIFKCKGHNESPHALDLLDYLGVTEPEEWGRPPATNSDDDESASPDLPKAEPQWEQSFRCEMLETGEKGGSGTSKPVPPVLTTIPSQPERQRIAYGIRREELESNSAGPLAPPRLPFSNAPGEWGEMGAVTAPVPVPPILPETAPTATPGNKAPCPVEPDIAPHIFKPAPVKNSVIAALKAANLYQHPLGDGAHVFTCIRAREHTDSGTDQATYREPTPTHPYGRCSCGHAHTPKVDIHQLIDDLGLSLFEASCKARVRLHPGETDLVAKAVELVLAQGAYFHSKGRLTRLARDWHQRISIERPNEHSVSSELATSIYWERKLEKGWVRTDPPRAVVQDLLNSQHRMYLRPLDGVARQPVLRPDGSLVTVPGYDARTRLFVDFRQEDYPFGEPSEEGAERSLAYLMSLLTGYEFASEADKAAFLAAMVTAAIRPSLSQAPAFLFTAPESGSGKSHAATLVSQFATDEPPHAVSYPASAEEATKLIPSLLRGYPAVILFDDTQENWSAFGAINKALTSPTVTERELGVSGLITVSTNSLFLGTGNDIEPLGDLRRRVVTIRLEPAEDSPALRRFSFDPVREVASNRPRAVMAALEIIRAYQAAGCPTPKAPPIGTFEEWSRWCRAPLIWLGLPDPATTLIGRVRDDPDRQARKRLLFLLHERFDSDPTQVHEMILAAERSAELLEAMSDLPVMTGSTVNAKKLGQYLKHKCRRHVDGWRVVECDAARWRRAWRIVGPPGGPNGADGAGDPSGGTGEMGERPFRPFVDDNSEPRLPKKAYAAD